MQQNSKGERQTLRGYDSLNDAQAYKVKNHNASGAYYRTPKVDSDFGKNVFHHLSNVDTDRMQNQFLSSKEVEPVKPSYQSIALPSIYER